MLLVFARLTATEADDALVAIRQFFAEHPERRTVTVGTGEHRRATVRRGQEIDAIRKLTVEDWQPHERL